LIAWEIREGDVLDRLREMPTGFVQCAVTSPPYWGLRDYGQDGQLGLEATPDEYVTKMVEVFAEVRRVLRDDGTLWLNLGDSYAGRGKGPAGNLGAKHNERHLEHKTGSIVPNGTKPKDLVGIPWRVAFALQADGWYLRSDIIWHKPNPMPESVTDRPTKAHEYVFLLTKSRKYFYDADAIAEDAEARPQQRLTSVADQPSGSARVAAGGHNPTSQGGTSATRNKRTVWKITTKPYSEAHFATFPPDLPELCIKAGSSEHGCCAGCGAAWERVTERTGVVLKKPAVPIADRRGNDVNDKRTALSGTQLAPATSRTVGWRPSCDCEQHEDAPGELIERPDEATDRWVYPKTPCTVLDPFSGAGTTGMVALRLGRSYIGIELNPEYAEMSRQRIDSDCPLFNRHE
jgi:DNA modification methylase